ncbi:MAG: HXXEE domain-containing protein [Solirubrobacterales bacterium]|nr:HXXEE domain-containing protein [Solirubrobacterales bacterium]
MRWLVDEWQWPYAGTVAAVFLLALLPLWWDATGAALALVYAVLPLYMLHQLEEHAGDRFRARINATVAHGREVLTRPATFWVNALGVWATVVVVLWLAYFTEPALGLIAVYLMAVNAVAHIGDAARTGTYNPGLGTAILVFVPLSVWAAIEVSDASGAGLGYQLLALGYAVGLHLGLIAYIGARRARLGRVASER